MAKCQFSLEHIKYLYIAIFTSKSAHQRTVFQEYDDRKFATGRAAGGLSLDWSEGLEPGDRRQYVGAFGRRTLPYHRIGQRQRFADRRGFPAGRTGKRAGTGGASSFSGNRSAYHALFP